ncbi:G polyprotein [Dissostichus eleginoides]|uniref:G polyprotein n=1 Tax=Dissostichus eleginoides TaxID=100907 RepID=A0AAD9BYX3_DISEL|nr:G polyprotein [Dissostichus eleginoides]
MATKHNPDPNNPTSKEGKRMDLELKHEHMLAEAKKAAEEMKRACSVGDTLQSPKRGCVGRCKPRGRRGGRRQGSATVTSPPTEGFQSSSVEVLRTEPSAQHVFEKNMERLSDILSSCPPPEPQKSSASSWSFRQQKASERWKEARPHHLQCLLEKEAVGHPLCGLCHEPAVISPTTCVVRVEGGYDTHDQACILPTVKAPNCSCKGTNFTVVPGKPVILITINGRYDLHLPLYVCQTCQQQWTPDLKVLLKSGYWPASVSISTLYTLDLLSSFEELKVISPGFSRQAFAKLLEHRTKCGGRSGPVNGDALQRSFLEFSYASYEEDQLCCGTSKRLLEETASLEELKTELHCVSDDMVSTWISDVKEWASGTSETSGTSEDILQTALQQSIEGLYLSVRQRKQSLYRQNDSSKLRHRLRRKLADDKKRLNQEILKYNQLVHDSARGIDAAVEHSLSGGSIMSALWPWEVHGMGIQEKILDQVMLTRRLQEEKGILLLEMAQHCTWLQNMAVALKNKVAEEDVDQGNGGLGCTLRRKHSEASERLQVVLQQYKTALGPDASFLQHEEESQSGLSSPDTSEDEEGNII